MKKKLAPTSSYEDMTAAFAESTTADPRSVVERDRLLLDLPLAALVMIDTEDKLGSLVATGRLSGDGTCVVCGHVVVSNPCHACGNPTDTK